MNVKDCMNRHVIAVEPEESVAVASRLMARHNVGALPVRARDGSLCGIVTDRDVVLRCVALERSPQETTVARGDDRPGGVGAAHGELKPGGGHFKPGAGEKAAGGGGQKNRGHGVPGRPEATGGDGHGGRRSIERNHRQREGNCKKSLPLRGALGAVHASRFLVGAGFIPARGRPSRPPLRVRWKFYR